MVSTRKYNTNQKQSMYHNFQWLLEYTITKWRSIILGKCDYLWKARNENESRKGEAMNENKSRKGEAMNENESRKGEARNENESRKGEAMNENESRKGEARLLRTVLSWALAVITSRCSDNVMSPGR